MRTVKRDKREPKKQGYGKYIFKYYARACVRRYFQYDVGRESAALAYYLLFSIFPLMIFFSILLGYAHLNQSPIIAGLYDFLPVEHAVHRRIYFAYHRRPV